VPPTADVPGAGWTPSRRACPLVPRRGGTHGRGPPRSGSCEIPASDRRIGAEIGAGSPMGSRSPVAPRQDWLCQSWYERGVVRVELLATVPNVTFQRYRAEFEREGVVRSSVPRGRVRRRGSSLPGWPPTRAPRLPRTSRIRDKLGGGVVSVRPVCAGDEGALRDERSDAEARRWLRARAPPCRRPAAGTVGSGSLAGRQRCPVRVIDGPVGVRRIVGLRMTAAALRVVELAYGGASARQARPTLSGQVN